MLTTLRRQAATGAARPARPHGRCRHRSTRCRLGGDPSPGPVRTRPRARSSTSPTDASSGSSLIGDDPAGRIRAPSVLPHPPGRLGEDVRGPADTSTPAGPTWAVRPGAARRHRERGADRRAGGRRRVRRAAGRADRVGIGPGPATSARLRRAPGRPGRAGARGLPGACRRRWWTSTPTGRVLGFLGEPPGQRARH